jgi:hypothetical protein
VAGPIRAHSPTEVLPKGLSRTPPKNHLEILRCFVYNRSYATTGLGGY